MLPAAIAQTEWDPLPPLMLRGLCDTGRMGNFFRVCALLLCVLLACQPAGAYSLLTHEQLIDLTWQSSIVPLLRGRYPKITDAQLEEARSYAYAGCVVQDVGYYPFGDPFLSDLTHYVRTGDFIVHLFRDAKDANQLAFAVGALSHYVGDPESKASGGVTRGVIRRLQGAGFSRVVRHADASGVVAYR